MPTYLAYPLSEELESELFELIHLIKTEDPHDHIPMIEGVIKKLGDEGMQYFFWKPVELAGVNALIRNIIKAGMNTGKKTIDVIAGKVIKRLTSEQLVIIAEFLEESLLSTESSE